MTAGDRTVHVDDDGLTPADFADRGNDGNVDPAGIVLVRANPAKGPKASRRKIYSYEDSTKPY